MKIVSACAGSWGTNDFLKMMTKNSLEISSTDVYYIHQIEELYGWLIFEFWHIVEHFSLSYFGHLQNLAQELPHKEIGT